MWEKWPVFSSVQNGIYVLKKACIHSAWTLGSFNFMCYCGNTEVEWIPKWGSAQKDENSPTTPVGTWTWDHLVMTILSFYHWANPIPKSHKSVLSANITFINPSVVNTENKYEPVTDPCDTPQVSLVLSKDAWLTRHAGFSISSRYEESYSTSTY